jgi:hypothetical protein
MEYKETYKMAEKLTPKQKKEHEIYLIMSCCKNPKKILLENGICKSEKEADRLIEKWSPKK